MTTSNREKAQEIVDQILAVDYNGNLKMFQEELGYIDNVVIDVFWWLEDGRGDGKTVEECRLLRELY